MKKTIIYSIILCCSSLVTSVSAQQIGLRFPDTTMVQGDTIILPLMVDSTLTGQEVYSFNLDVRYDTYYFEYVGISNGELTSSFGEFIVNSNSGGALLISGANGSAISGTGVLLYIHLKAYRHNIWGSTMSLYSTSIFNEGLPHIIASSGRVSIQAAPTITIGPNDADLLVGESQMFRVYGDTVSPFLFSVEDSTVGKVNAEGLFTAMAPGYTKVKVTDINGNEDFTNNEVIVYGVQLSTSDDLREWQGSSVEVPVFIHNVSGENLISGSFQFSFNDYYLTYNDYNKEGSLLENASVEVVQLDDENLMVNFASSQALVGDSTLLYLSFDVSRTHTGYSYLDFSDILFNEGVAGLNERGRFQTINYQTVNLSYTKTDLIAREVLPLNFYGGLLPYTYASSDSSIARISTEGVVTAIKGGEVTFSATDSVGSQKVSNLFHVYDTYIAVPDTTGPVASDFLLPIYMGALSAGVSAEAFQIKLSYKMPELEFLEIVTTGSLTQGWSLAHSQEGNHLNISGASTGALSGDGVLFYVKFHLASELTINERVSVTIDDLVLNEGHPTAYLQNGYIKCVKPEDLLVSKLIAPLSDCDLTAEEEVVVEIKNNGYVDYHAGDTLMVSYRVYYQNTVYDTIVLDQDFPMKSVMNYTFKEKADFSQDNKQYGFEVQTELSSERDANPSNDRIYTQIFNFDNP
ncbi:MAG: cohesin domain-containing protein, partial [Bacteroidales bacterium]|nr:cohesin domain-containing protein [Bacteroidales bacterium]